MTTPLPRLWQALDEIPLATATTQEWLRRLGDDPAVSLSFLRASGTLAIEIDCPSPGGAGCPRKVIKLSSRRLRAVCGNNPAECDSVDLMTEDVTCLALDRKKFALGLCKLLQISPSQGADAVLIGTYPVMAAVGIPVALFIPGPDGAETSPTWAEVTTPAVVLVPTPTSISAALNQTLKHDGYSIWALSDFVRVDHQHRLVSLHEPEVLFRPIKAGLIADHSPKPIGRIWPLPAEVQWPDLTFMFVAAERLNVRYRKETRTFEPDQFGLKHKRTGRPTSGWTMLRSIAARQGVLRWAKESDRSKFEKQKQLLADRLKLVFGLPDEPFQRRRGQRDYQARFVTRDERPKGERDLEF